MTGVSARTTDATSALLAEACLRAIEGGDPPGASKYYRARYYDPKIGRFISEDPIGFKSGDANFYRYAYDSPLNWRDPYGLDVQMCFRPMHGMPSVSHPVIASTNTGVAYGFGPSSDWWAPLTPITRVPGRIETENPYDRFGHPTAEYSCHTESKDKCVEECVIQTAEHDAKHPPAYNLGTYQCNNYAFDLVKACKIACGAK